MWLHKQAISPHSAPPSPAGGGFPIRLNPQSQQEAFPEAEGISGGFFTEWMDWNAASGRNGAKLIARV